jgi:hypothetical protein
MEPDLAMSRTTALDLVVYVAADAARAEASDREREHSKRLAGES